MMISHIDHIAVNTHDIEKSVDFYREVFGFSETARADMGECILVYLKIDNHSSMELFDLKGFCKMGKAEENFRGVRHIAFHVDDIESWDRKLKELGVKYLMDLTHLKQIDQHCLLIEDPDGVVIELCADAKQVRVD